APAPLPAQPRRVVGRGDHTAPVCIAGGGAAECNHRDVACEYTFVTSRHQKEDIPMPTPSGRAMAVLGAALSTLAVPAVLGIAPAQGAPCTPTADNPCTTRLTTVTASSSDGTITGAPMSGGAPVTL